MLRTVNPNRTLWEAILPEECLGMPPELVAVDALFDDEVFFAPYRAHFHDRLGRPSIPIETYLRLMFLKYRYRISFEVLCRETSDSLSWRRFCRIPLGERVPHPTTLMKITSRCGKGTVEELNELLLAKAHEVKVIKTDQVRADTTVVSANVAYPTDSGLLTRGVTKLSSTVAKLKALGLASRTGFQDRTRSMRRRAHQIGVWLRRRTGEAKSEVYAINAEMAAIATLAVRDARRVARNAARGLRRAGGGPGRARALIAELEQTAGLVEQVAAQTRQRLAGDTPSGSTRVVSLHDPDARPIRKGRLGKPVEFGYKAQVVDNTDGVVLDHEVMMGNPSDAPLLVPAIRRIAARFQRTPKAVTADRGYGEARVETELTEMGVTTVAIPRKGRPGQARQAVQRSRGFVRLIKWRTGSEGRISYLKRCYGWDRTLIDSLAGAQTWCGFGILAHNAVKISDLIGDQADPTPRSLTAPLPKPAATGPPHTTIPAA